MKIRLRIEKSVHVPYRYWVWCPMGPECDWGWVVGAVRDNTVEQAIAYARVLRNASLAQPTPPEAS